jgi:nucleotide-binding universal stress UspA family protein
MVNKSIIFLRECQYLIRKILVPVDGSDISDKVLDFALDFAGTFDAKITILNVTEPPTMGAVPMEPTTISNDSMVVFVNDLKKFHEGVLAKAIAHAKLVKPNSEVSTKLREGDPALEIVAEAKESGFDLVVVGHRGLGRVEELFLGSVSERVAHLAPCPVVIVR